MITTWVDTGEDLVFREDPEYNLEIGYLYLLYHYHKDSDRELRDVDYIRTIEHTSMISHGKFDPHGDDRGRPTFDFLGYQISTTACLAVVFISFILVALAIFISILLLKVKRKGKKEPKVNDQANERALVSCNKCGAKSEFKDEFCWNCGLEL